MNVFSFLKQDVEKVTAWIKSKEPEFVTAIQEVANFTSQALAWAKSPQGVTVEAFLTAYVPKSAAWEGEATAIATALLQDMSKVTNVASLEAIALRLGAEILQIVDGKKLPTGISGYLAEFQQIFVG